MNKLKNIQDDAPMRNELRTFMYETLDAYALDKLYKNESVVGISDAKAVIDIVFDKLDK